MGTRSSLNNVARTPLSLARTARSWRRGVFGRWLPRFLASMLVLALGTVAHAQSGAKESLPPNRELGANQNALCGLVRTGTPVCPEKRLTVAATTGYGYTESMGPVDGSHTRLVGVVAASYVPLDWLALALTLDGRMDMHPNDSLGKNRTATGEPRLSARVGRMLPRGMSAGGELVLWFPGNEAPSFEPKAVSADFKALFAWTPTKKPLSLLANVGFRMDNSANSAPDLRRVRPGDRVALGLSDSHAMLVALGGAYRVQADVQAFGELSADILFGSDAPSFTQSPLRVTVGARYFLSKKLAFEGNLTGVLSGRPGLSPTDPLVPIEPRVSINLGVRYNAWQPADPEQAIQEITDEETARVVLKTTETITGLVLDDSGAPLPEVEVKVVNPDPEQETPSAVTNGSGRYLLADIPFGRVKLEASALGFESQTWETDVYAGMPEQAARTLVPEKHEGGLLRGLIRSFGSTPLSATVTVLNKRGKQVAQESTDSQGRFEIALPEGKYRVVVKATGYKQHKGEIQISAHGVAILNVDMRQE